MKKQYKSMSIMKVNFNSKEQVAAACIYRDNGKYIQLSNGDSYCTFSSNLGTYLMDSDNSYVVGANPDSNCQYL